MENYRIRTLVGSILRDDFRPDSDVDVLVSFAPDERWSLFDIVTMKEELKISIARSIWYRKKD